MNKKLISMGIFSVVSIIPIPFVIIFHDDVNVVTSYNFNDMPASEKKAELNVNASKDISSLYGLEDRINPKSEVNAHFDEYNARIKTGYPFHSDLSASDVVKWTPGRYSDDEFMRSNQPLEPNDWAQERINSTQTKKKFTWLYESSYAHKGSYPSAGERYKFQSDLKNGIHGTDQVDGIPKNHSLTDWSYLDTVVSWNSVGSSLELPPKWLTEDAHRNGVKSLATLFYISTSDNVMQMYNPLMHLDTGDTSNAKKLAIMAKYYGFDGYYLNLEAIDQISESLNSVTNMKKFVNELYTEGKKMNPNFSIEIYQYGMGEKFFSNRNKNYIYSYNYPVWTNNDGNVEKNTNIMWEFSASKFTGIGNSGALIKKELTNDYPIEYFSKGPVNNSEESQLKFFSSNDELKDPRHEASKDPSKFISISKAILEKTTLLDRKPWGTSFNNGKGMKYFREGMEVPLSDEYKKFGFRDESLQDLMPTYRYINDIYDDASLTNLTKDSAARTDQVNTSLLSIGDDEGHIKQYGNFEHPVFNNDWDKVDMANKIAFNGSSLINFNGMLQSGEVLVNKAFAAKNQILVGDTFNLVVNKNANKGKFNLVVWIMGKDNKTHPISVNAYSDSKVNPSSEAEKLSFHLDQFAGKTIYNWGFAFENNGSNDKIDIDLLSMAFKPASTEKHNCYVNSDSSTLSASKVFQSDYMSGDNNSKYMRLNWEVNDQESNTLVRRYDIFVTDENYQGQKLVGMSSSTVAYLKEIGDDVLNKYHLIIKGYDSSGNKLVEQKVAVHI